MHDRARIHVQAGAGGDGALSFRREAHVPKGGPDGGDGGRGGDVVLVCSDSLRDLESFRRRAHYKARRGGHGEGSLRHGADGGTLELAVPPGTEVLVEGDGARYDLVRGGQRAVVARGGPGGRGNKRFAGPTHQTPRFAERGLPGDETWLELRLKLLADVGLIGLPNAGKSSLLARLTRAHPKVAGYPFTTLSPVLGTLQTDTRQLVLADIPGLIEGASDGAGLGHEFLAHVERTRLLVHVLDLNPLDGSDPVANHATVEHELASHDPRLAALPRILALSKADLVDAQTAAAARAAWQERLGDAGSGPGDLGGQPRGPGRARRRARAPRPRDGGPPTTAPRTPPPSSPPSTSPSIRCSARRRRGPTRSGAPARGPSPSPAPGSSGCWPAMTSTTRRRWPTWSGACAGSGS